jgi:hypothetical protein
MSVGTERQNIIILFWKLQIHFWEYINGNQTWILTSPLFAVHFLLSSYQALNHCSPGSLLLATNEKKDKERDKEVLWQLGGGLKPNKTT